MKSLPLHPSENPLENRGEAWRVLRHSGRTGAAFRVEYEGPEPKARQVYEAISIKLRQGTVRLEKAGEFIAQVSAPRLRTRW